MGLPSQPLKAVFPIVLLRKVPETIYSFLGTGFFINVNGLFISAKHVFSNINMDETVEYNAVILDLANDKAIPYIIKKLEFSEKFDIALGYVRGVQDIQPLRLAIENSPMNYDVLTVEFSGTHSEQLVNGKVAINFIPYFRKGHVICYYKSDFPESETTQCMDISFPALKGASGAPVIVERNGSVIGMVTDNVERELLPAQIEKIICDEKHTEEIKYFLPTAKAISWVHLTSFINSIAFEK